VFEWLSDAWNSDNKWLHILFAPAPARRRRRRGGPAVDRRPLPVGVCCAGAWWGVEVRGTPALRASAGWV